jgi:hypothetical protein
MKHLNHNGFWGRKASNTSVSRFVFSANQEKNYSHFVLVSLISILLLPGIVAGQCSVTCLGNDESQPLEMSAQADCQISLTADMLLNPDNLCTGDKDLVVRDAMNNILAEGTNSVDVTVSDYLNSTLSVTVTDQTTSLFCVSFVRVIDDEAPLIDCQQINISCVADTAAVVVGFPTVTDNCDANVELSYTDIFIDGDCNSPSSALVNRVWTALDASGNVSVCTQSIFLDKPDVNNVIFPDDYFASCENSSVPLSATGQPILDGVIIENGTYCDLSVGFSDDTLYTCGFSEWEIVRTWSVKDLCTDFTVSADQTIFFSDEIAPEIICPADIIIDTDAGECFATVMLPEPTVSDNCDAGASYSVNTSWGEVGLGPHPFVPVGTHSVIYTAIDACGNFTNCTISVTVRDQEEPTAVCEQNTIVSVPSPGLAVVMAESFDDGSHDNCPGQIYFKVRKMDIGSCNNENGDDSNQNGYQEWFDDHVIFCCEEATGDDVIVVLRVYEVDPGPGPVDPVREQPGGDLHGAFTECMVSVEVQDKIFPTIECPADVTVDCEDDLSDLSIFGDAIIADNCSYEVEIVDVENLDECHVGTINRTFRATDPSGNSSACTQTITVDNLTPFSEDNITWPENFTSTECGADTEPEDLPDGFDFPVIDESQACGIIAVNHEDNLFDIAFPACYKILRVWTVIDWCEYEPEYPENGGRFTHTQIIKIQDEDDPVMECPEPIRVAVSGDCITGWVDVPVPAVEDCNEDVVLTHDSPYADNPNGPDASGAYPLGVTQVTFTAIDQCGNFTSCTVDITVEDLTPPGAVCIVGLSVNLAEDEGSIQAIIDAESFDASSTDNCTADEDLVKTIRRAITDPSDPPTSTELTFTCSDLGIQLIEFWVTDELGNSDYCTTYISVQDNNGICPATVTDMGMVAGGIFTESGEMVEDVNVQINTYDPQEYLTSLDGHFEFPDVPMGEDYTVVPSRDDDVMNGISTLDLLLITKHIIGVQALDSPYKIIAADVDRSGNISTLDLVRLRRLILNIDSTFPNGNTSWRFVPADFEFPNPENPFEGYFPEIYNINDFEADLMDVEFIAIKVGDVNGSVIPTNFGGLDERSNDGNLELMVEDVAFEAGETITVPFSASLEDLEGYQFTLNFDSEALEFQYIESTDLEDMTEANFGLTAVERGFITTSWNTKDNQNSQEEAILFTIVFTSKRASSLHEALFINSIMTKAEAYLEDGSLLDVSLNVSTINGTVSGENSEFELYQNRPNPFDGTTVIGFNLPAAGQASLTVFDLNGRLIYTNEAAFDQGYNEFKIHSNDLNVGGVLYYKLESAGFTATKKMILLD